MMKIEFRFHLVESSIFPISINLWELNRSRHKHFISLNDYAALICDNYVALLFAVVKGYKYSKCAIESVTLNQ